VSAPVAPIPPVEQILPPTPLPRKTIPIGAQTEPVTKLPPATGPVVWSAIIGTTVLLLFLLQKVLWLVVPFLLALILYYVLFPALTWLMYRGMGRERAAAVVMAAFVAVLVVLGFVFLPNTFQHLLDWKVSTEKYLLGGVGFLDRTLRALERTWPYLAQAHIADSTNAKLTDITGNAQKYLQPLVLALAAWTPSLLLTPFLTFFFMRDGGRFQHMLAAAVPNAFFEKTLYLMHEVDRTTRAYFVGLMKLTALDTITLALGLWIMGIPAPLGLGLLCAVLAWLPYFGSIAGGLLVVLVAATDFPNSPGMAYAAIGLFGLVRLLDDFVYMPITIGKSLHMHPVLTVMMLFIGGAVAGISGLMLALPLLGVVMVIGETIGKVVTDQRLMARYRHGKGLRMTQAKADLGF
jgi:predicted PurR-regulated permease PerM